VRYVCASALRFPRILCCILFIVDDGIQNVDCLLQGGCTQHPRGLANAAYMSCRSPPNYQAAKKYTYVFVDYGFFALSFCVMLHTNEILTWKSLTGITDDLYLGLAMGTTLAVITFAGMAFTYFWSVKLSD